MATGRHTSPSRLPGGLPLRNMDYEVRQKVVAPRRVWAESCGPVMEFALYSRRSGRIAKRIPVTLRWQPPGRDCQDEAAETILLSKYGCTVVCRNLLKVGGEIFVIDLERKKSVRARIIYRELTGGKQEVTLALEFLGNDNFWEIEFPPEAGFADGATSWFLYFIRAHTSFGEMCF